MSNTIDFHTPNRDEMTERQRYRLWPLALIGIAFVACFLLSIAAIVRAGQLPLKGMGFDHVEYFTPPLSPFLTLWGAWLPDDLHLGNNHIKSLYLTDNLEILLLLACAFLIYGLLSWWLLRRAQKEQIKFLRLFLWIGTIIVGIALVFTPGMSSKDLFVYADYGNMVWQHGANPYFMTPFQAAPHDILTIIDTGWHNAPSAYGPVWILVTIFFSMLFGSHPLFYFYGYRLLGLICHLIIIWLVGKILRTTDRSERIVVLGMLLYGWNPLALFENSFGAHNDVFMSMFLVCGVYLSVYADKKGFVKPPNYLPALIAFTLAILVKFISLPLIVFFLLLLAGKTLKENNEKPKWLQWRSVAVTTITAGAIFLLLSLLFYLPFWIGHSVGDIIRSFSAPPSSTGSENSFMRLAIIWLKDTHGGNAANPLLTRLALLLQARQHWNQIDVVTLAIALLLGAWFLLRKPELRTFIQASLATLALILTATPWFYSWYVIWLVALVPLLLAYPPFKRFDAALLAFSLVCSATVFIIYADFGLFTIPGTATWLRHLLMVAPPLIVMLITYAFKRPREQRRPHLHGEAPFIARSSRTNTQ
ncbi:hypothetical protein [Dictyobacter arantiisoli]|uniref:Uncharacterized protein n=1 Tax=Dictyobacter arantiisoli TaxID=2014874 RepID=A0A5A5THC6_9CHLR|nr:hypothetical protein [Dictyobacter arantiisoli]GCF10645.1 hypothetical protein KDI_42090 [Dictyobacter arantiisoli]